MALILKIRLEGKENKLSDEFGIDNKTKTILIASSMNSKLSLYRINDLFSSGIKNGEAICTTFTDVYAQQEIINIEFSPFYFDHDSNPKAKQQTIITRGGRQSNMELRFLKEISANSHFIFS